MHLNILKKNVFVEKVWPANLALFIYVSIHCVETVKWPDYNRHTQLTRFGCKRSLVQSPAPGTVFKFDICFVVVVVFFTLMSKNILFVTQV